MCDTRTRLTLFAWQKDAAGAALKRRLWAPANKKINITLLFHIAESNY